MSKCWSHVINHSKLDRSKVTKCLCFHDTDKTVSVADFNDERRDIIRVANPERELWLAWFVDMHLLGTVGSRARLSCGVWGVGERGRRRRGRRRRGRRGE